MVYGYKGLSRLGDFDTWIRGQYGGHFQFLTIDGLFAGMLVMFTGLLLDLFPRTSKGSFIFESLTNFKRLLVMIALPVAAVVASVYWPLILVLPKLILTEDFTVEPTSKGDVATPFRIPLDIDLSLHGFPGPLLVLDFLLFEKKFSQETMQKYAPLLALCIGTTYAMWAEYCATKNNYFPYPFLTFSSLPIRVVIYATCTTFSVFVFRALNWLHQ